ncbi:ribonuclease H-like domain-containing protein, partial [Tanacetum coccineum]
MRMSLKQWNQKMFNLGKNFAPTAVLTKSGLIPINTARQSSSRAAVPVSTARPINTAAPKPFGDLLVSHRCVTGKNSVLFTESECLILSPEFKLPDESQVMLKIPKNDNMYSFDLKNVFPTKGLTCLFANATNDESKMWHRRLGHINLKTINKLVKGNFVRGLPSKIFEKDHSCVACQKGKQHKATWIKREFYNARTPQQNGVAERKNRTLIEAARTMLADSLLPITFWAEAVNTACHVQNR